MSLLTPDIGLLFWMLLSFLIVFGVLAKAGFPIITGMVDKRRAHIEEGLRAADEATKRLESVEQCAQQMMDEAAKRQSEMLSEAVADGQRIVESARQRAEAESAEYLQRAREQIELEKQKALGELRTTVATLSVEVAEKVLREKMPAEDRLLIDRLVAEAEKRPTNNV